MNRWRALAVLLAVAALALRVPKLETRPFHNDEAVNAVKVTDLWQHGRYKYDPDEFHGPTLHYATLPFLWLSGARNADELKDSTLRLAPVVFGAGLILLLLLFADGLGRPAIVWAALFTAVSPAMVFYSRYFIHEMLLVFFTALTLGAGWRYVRTGLEHGSAGVSPASLPPKQTRRRDAGAPRFWAVLTGIGLGLMFATKETFVLTLTAIGLAGIATVWWTKFEIRNPNSRNPKPETRIGATAHEPSRSDFGLRISFGSRISALGVQIKSLFALSNWKHAALAFSAAFIIWLLLFSSFFTNFAGLLDSLRTYLPWLHRAAGDSTHIHPWNFYLERLAWFHPAKGPVWSEGLILILALVGAFVSLAKKKSPLHRFLALYTVLLTAIYSAISYKTPWCLLNFYLGMILLAGVGAATIVKFFRAKALKAFATAMILLFVFFPFHRFRSLRDLPDSLSWQAWRASVVYAADRRNPYVYAQTGPNLLELVQRTEGLARVAPGGYETVVKVIAPEGDYWPLPWSLRRFKHVGWYDKLPNDAFAPIVIVSSRLDALLDEKSGRKWLMVGLTELRPGKFFEQYVELELWKKYVETLPRQQD